MTFYEVLEQVVTLLQRHGRMSYRALTRQFQLDEAYLADLKAELVDIQRVAVDHDGIMLVWTGDAPAALPPVTSAPASERPAHAYTPAHLTEKILAARAALEGERKQVTVLFADLKGSTELIQGLDPEEARALLDPALHIMMAAVHRYEGTVNQVLGDGIMALFGAPLAHEDHAVRACYAALHMQEAIGRYADELRRQQGLDVQIRVGLNSGAVVVRAIGNDLHMDYTAVGQTTHLAARMEQLARPGTALLTADTLRLVEGYIEVTPLGPVPVKGLPEPVEVYELLRAGPVRSRLQAAVARGPDALCGARCGAGAPAPGTGTRRGGAGAGGGRRWGGGRGQVPLALRVHPVAPHPRLVAAGQPFGVLWQGDRLSARSRPAQGLLPDRTPGRHPPLAREGHGQAADARPRPGADAASLAGAAGGASRRSSSGRRSIPRNAASARWRPSSACCCAKARCNRCA